MAALKVPLGEEKREPETSRPNGTVKFGRMACDEEMERKREQDETMVSIDKETDLII